MNKKNLEQKFKEWLFYAACITCALIMILLMCFEIYIKLHFIKKFW